MPVQLFACRENEPGLARQIKIYTSDNRVNQELRREWRRLAGSLCGGRQKRTTHKPEIRIGNFDSIQTVALEESMPGVKNIVLVHGAWADGSSWSKLIPLLKA